MGDSHDSVEVPAGAECSSWTADSNKWLTACDTFAKTSALAVRILPGHVQGSCVYMQSPEKRGSRIP